MGGKFADGFLSAAGGKAASLGKVTGRIAFTLGGGASNLATRTITASIVGGTASAVSGGKFANGAYTAAFQHLFNKTMVPDNGATKNELTAISKLRSDSPDFDTLLSWAESKGYFVESRAGVRGNGRITLSGTPERGAIVNQGMKIGETLSVIAHEVFHLAQYDYYNPGPNIEGRTLNARTPVGIRNLLKVVSRPADFRNKHVLRGSLSGLVSDFEARRIQRRVARQNYSVNKVKIRSPNDYAGIPVPEIK